MKMEKRALRHPPGTHQDRNSKHPLRRWTVLIPHKSPQTLTLTVGHKAVLTLLAHACSHLLIFLLFCWQFFFLAVLWGRLFILVKAQRVSSRARAGGGQGRRQELQLACCKLSLDPAASSSCCYHMMDLFSAPCMISCTAKALREQWHPNLGWVSSVLQWCCSKTHNRAMRILQEADIDLLDRKTFLIWQLWWNWVGISTTKGPQEIEWFRKPERNNALSVMEGQETKHAHSRCSGLADLIVLFCPQTCQLSASLPSPSATALLKQLISFQWSCLFGNVPLTKLFFSSVSYYDTASQSLALHI